MAADAQLLKAHLMSIVVLTRWFAGTLLSAAEESWTLLWGFESPEFLPGG